MTSTENGEHKKGVSLFKRLKVSSLFESKRLFSYISVSDGKNIWLKWKRGRGDSEKSAHVVRRESFKKGTHGVRATH